ncbi:PREDICTED: synaptotagmin-12 [Hipposideros armiger]|uniref:Synaptotagmin-12 n=1 Tax=Hipposideros armiger TaxID=186990 RepID=A0A8B7RIN8_HIPAR|nr:PREDICTED: synaptotagmin-12 [Hipposideros armiger]
MRGCSCLAVIKSPPDWEVGVYAAGALALLGVAAVSLWKLWTSGSFPSPSPFPNYDYRYLQQKYGETYAEARQKRVPAWNAQRPSTRGPPSRKGSLSIEDTFESISELGPLELMGRELDLAPYGTLRKSQSADSLNSISSVSNTFGQDFTLGQVEVSMDYDATSHTLHVAVLQGKDLLEREEASFESCFMRVSLLPDEQIVGISRLREPVDAAHGGQLLEQKAGWVSATAVGVMAVDVAEYHLNGRPPSLNSSRVGLRGSRGAPLDPRLLWSPLALSWKVTGDRLLQEPMKVDGESSPEMET